MSLPRLTLPLLVLLAACRNEDPRIAAAEAVAEATCACSGLVCAVEAASPLLDARGLEQEDYENLPEDQIARFWAAYSRAEICVRALTLE